MLPTDGDELDADQYERLQLAEVAVQTQRVRRLLHRTVAVSIHSDLLEQDIAAPDVAPQ